jgi:tripartite-type tricarboxylate transporter receptor subunit TctC
MRMHRPDVPLGATRRRLAAALAALVPAAAAPRPDATQPRYPARPVRVVVPFPPSGSTDIYARLLAARLSERLGQPVLVDNRPGAGGAIAAGLVVRAEPDGHTVLYTSSALAILPSLRPDLGFDVRRDLVPVALVYEAPLLLVAAPAFAEAATVAGLVPGSPSPGPAGRSRRGMGGRPAGRFRLAPPLPLARAGRPRGPARRRISPAAGPGWPRLSYAPGGRFQASVPGGGGRCA